MAITLRRGDHHRIDGSVVTQEGAPVNITGWAIWFLCKRRWPDGDGSAVVTKQTAGMAGDIAITDGPGGLFTITIRPEDFSAIPNAERTRMIYDVQCKATDGSIRTLAQEDLIILGDVTFATA